MKKPTAPRHAMEALGLDWDQANSMISPPTPAVVNAAPLIAAPSSIMILSLLIFDGIDGFNSSSGKIAVYVISVLLVAVVYGLVWVCTLRLLPWGDSRAFCRYVASSLDIRAWLVSGVGDKGGAEEEYASVPNADSARDENEEVREERGVRGVEGVLSESPTHYSQPTTPNPLPLTH